MVEARKGRGAGRSVAIGIVTYRRPDQVAGLLRSLGGLEPLGPGAELACVVVVDNDPEGSARAAVQAVAAELPIPVRYEVESEPGISAARNRVLELASDCRLLAFIDDDETPTAGWLRHLVAVQVSRDAALVAGPTLSLLPPGTPEWVRESGAFDRPRMTTGSTFQYAGSGNLLIDLEATAGLRPLFDLRYGLLGGSDTHLFVRARDAGMSMVWCDEAEVTEAVPPARVSSGWMVKRAFRGGNTVGLCERETRQRARRLRVLSMRCLKGVVHIVVGLAGVIQGALSRRRAKAINGRRRMANGAGMIAGSFGYSYAEYRRKTKPQLATTSGKESHDSRL